MATSNDRIVAVFGGTGFLGRRVVRHLRQHGFSVRTASRHPASTGGPSALDDPHLQSVEANIHDDQSIARVVAGAYGVVNAVSLYVEHGKETFHSVHVEAARRLAARARAAGVERLVQVSGIGADGTSPSLYVRKRGEGELAVRAAFAEAHVFRPAVMFGPDDSFLTVLLGLLQRLPIYPMFGRGQTRLQPAHVEDVAEAIARAMHRTENPSTTVECAGPRIYTYEQLLRIIAHAARLEPRLVPVPFAVWHALAGLAELLPSPPITRGQVELMQVDTVSSKDMPGFGDLGISSLRSVEEALLEICGVAERTHPESSD